MGEDKNRQAKPAKAGPGASRKDDSHKDLGSSLRSVYERTVSEDVPAEMLDLLNKLG